VASGNASTDCRTLFIEKQVASAPCFCLYNILDLKTECFVPKTLGKICNNFPAFVRDSLWFLHLGIFSYHPAQHKSQAFPESCKAIDVHGITTASQYFIL